MSVCHVTSELERWPRQSLGRARRPKMDRRVLQEVFDRVDVRGQRVVSRRDLIAELAADACLAQLLRLPDETVVSSVRRDFMAAFGLDDGKDRIITFDEFAMYLERSFSIAASAHPPAPRPPEPEPEPQMMASAFDIGGGGDDFGEYGGAPLASSRPPSMAERLNRTGGDAAFAGGASTQELELERQIAALELAARGGSAVGGPLSPQSDYGSASQQNPEFALESQIAELEARAAAAERVQREAASRGSQVAGELSMDELELERHIAALEHAAQGGAAPGGAVGGISAAVALGGPPARKTTGEVSEAQRFMEQRRVERQSFMDEGDDDDDLEVSTIEGIDQSFGPGARGTGWRGSSYQPQLVQQGERSSGFGRDEYYSEEEEEERQPRPRGLVAEVYAPSNPHGRSVWRHTPYGQDAPPPGPPPAALGGRMPVLGHRSVSETGNMPPFSPSGGIADRSRSMLQDRTDSVPSPRAMLSPARTRGDGGGAAPSSFGGISQRSRQLAAERSAPLVLGLPSRSGGRGGGLVGARERLTGAGQLGGHVEGGIRSGSPGRSLAPSLGRGLSVGRTRPTASGMTAQRTPSPQAGRADSSATASAAGSAAAQQTAASLREKLAPKPLMAPPPPPPETPEHQPPPPKETPPPLDSLTRGTAVRAARGGGSVSSPAAVEMSDLEKMKERRRNKARSALKSSGLSGAADHEPTAQPAAVEHQEPERGAPAELDASHLMKGPQRSVFAGAAPPPPMLPSPRDRAAAPEEDQYAGYDGKAEQSWGAPTDQRIDSPMRYSQSYHRSYSPTPSNESRSPNSHQYGDSRATSPGTRLSERAKEMHSERSSLSPRRRGGVELNVSARLSPGRSASRAKDLRSRQVSPKPWHKSEGGYRPPSGRGGSPGRTSATKRANASEFLDKLSSMGDNSSRNRTSRSVASQRREQPRRQPEVSSTPTAPQSAREPMRRDTGGGAQQLSLVPGLPARDNSRARTRTTGILSVGRSGRSPVERPSSRGRGNAAAVGTSSRFAPAPVPPALTPIPAPAPYNSFDAPPRRSATDILAQHSTATSVTYSTSNSVGYGGSGSGSGGSGGNSGGSGGGNGGADSPSYKGVHAAEGGRAHAVELLKALRAQKK